MLNKIFGFIIKNRVAAVLIIILFTCFFGLQMKNLYFENRMTQWVPEDDPVLKLLLHTGDLFGSNQLVLITFKIDNRQGFCKETLTQVKSLTEELSKNEQIFLISSLYNSPHITQIPGGIEVRDFLEEIPENKEGLVELKELALSKDTLVNNVISSDGEWLAVSVYIDSEEDLIEVFRETIKPTVEKHLPSTTEVFYSGIPSDAYFADEFVSSDIKKLIPLIVILILSVLYLSFRHWKGIVFPFIVVVIAVLWTFGIMGLFRSPLNLISPALPVLLMALGSAYGIHVVNILFSQSDLTNQRLAQVQSAASRVASPVVLAGLTTMAGFVSFLTVKLKIISEFGFFSALGILFAVIISLVFIPSAHAIFKGREKTAQKRHMSFLSPFLRVLFHFVKGNKKFVLGLTVVLILGLGYGLFIIKRQVNFSQYYPKNSTPRVALEIVRKHFGGSFPLTVYFKGDSIKSAASLRVIRRVSLYLGSVPEASQPFSLADFIEELNFQLNDRYHIPENDRGVGNLWFFLEGRDELNQIISSDLTESQVFARVSNAEIEFMRRTRDKINDFLDQEYSKNPYIFNLENLDKKQAQELRKIEASTLLDEIDWLIQSYEEASFTKESALPKLHSLVQNFPEPKDQDVKMKASSEFKNTIYSEFFDFLISDDIKETLVQKCVLSLSESETSAQDFKTILKQVIPEEEYDDEIAFDVASTLSFRVTESLRSAFSERAFKEITPLIDFNSQNNTDFSKKLKGLLYEITDNMVILPQKMAPFKGQPVQISRIEQSGHPIFMTRLDHLLYTSQIQSLILALVITFILIMIVSRSFIWGCISIFPIGFTLYVIYSFLGLAGIPLDFATMMIAGVCIGVGIDYVIHFTHGIREKVKQGYGIEEAVQHVFMEKGKAILANSLAVMTGFLVLLFSSMSPLINFGGVMAGAMFLAALSTLTILPSLILIFKPKIGGKK
ncbi:MAG: efflux RND transporter permease subunit [Acidobacteriota bacterium]